MSLASRFFGSRADYPDPADVSLDLPATRAHEIVANKRRKYTIRTLARLDAGEGVPLDRIIEHVAARESGTTTSEVTKKQYNRAYTGLHQAHLDVLEESGLVNHDSEEGILYATPDTHEAVTFMDVAEMMGAEK